MTPWPHRLAHSPHPLASRRTLAHRAGFFAALPFASLIGAALLFAATPAQAVVNNLVFGAGYAAASLGSTSTEAYSGTGAWYKLYPGAKFEMYIDVSAQFGSSFTISQIQSITYHTLNDATNPTNSVRDP